MCNAYENALPLLEVSDLTVAYSRGLGTRFDVIAADNISFSVARGQTLGLIGESGSGKSTVLNAIAGLVKPISGKIIFEGTELSRFCRKEIMLRRGIGMVFQSAAVNPKMKVHDIIAEPIRNFERLRREAELSRIWELLELVKLPVEFASRYPGELSGGQLQRVGIARALAARPTLILADEPVTALDASIRRQVLDMFSELITKLGISCVFVTHDLSVARRMCNTICIMQKGKIIEYGDKNRVFENPENLYTKLLIQSVLTIDLDKRDYTREQRQSLLHQYLKEQTEG